MAKSKKKKKTTKRKQIAAKSKKNINRKNKKNIKVISKPINKKTTKKKVSSKKKTNNKKKTTKVIKTKKTINISFNYKKSLIYLLSILLIFIIINILYFNIFKAPIAKIDKVTINDNNLRSIHFKTNKFNLRNKTYCYYSKDTTTPTLDNDGWFETELNMCNFYIDDNVYYAYFKNEDNIIYRISEVNNIGRIYNFKLSLEKLYLPINGEETITYTYDKVGYINNEIEWISDNEEIATVDNGKIVGKSKGETTIHASIMNQNAEIKVIVTDLITVRPKDGFDYDKDFLPCEAYNKEANDLIDEILKTKIENVGYKTRAGVVEAARFLTLDFPYRINYFNENGRQTTNNVDGEGRYYHVGFYLDNTRYDNITGSQNGPVIWGCSMYSRPVKRYMANGLDCSGFVSWALLNGGFDVGDVGAGWSGSTDLTDYGDVRRLTTSLATSDEIKVGDLLHSERAGGHIAIIVGIDDDYYYVAQALWYNERGVIITEHKKSSLPSSFPHVVLMDDYYEKDGKLTNMW